MYVTYEDKLVRFTAEQIGELRENACRYLVDNEFDSVGCANALGLDLGEFFELRNRFYGEFRLAEEVFYAKLEHKLAQAALGKADLNNAQLATIRFVLERRKREWAPMTKKVEDKAVPKSNGKGIEILKAYLEGPVKEDIWEQRAREVEERDKEQDAIASEVLPKNPVH